MKRKFFCLAIVLVMLVSVSIMATGCGKKTEERIVYANIVIENREQSESQTVTTSSIDIDNKLIDTYEELMNSSAVKTVIEKQYGTVGKIQFEKVENTQIIKVSYVCDGHTDEECKKMLNDWIAEFSRKMKEIYNIKDINIIDEPEITTRIGGK